MAQTIPGAQCLHNDQMMTQRTRNTAYHTGHVLTLDIEEDIPHASTQQAHFTTSSPFASFSTVSGTFNFLLKVLFTVPYVISKAFPMPFILAHARVQMQCRDTKKS